MLYIRMAIILVVALYTSRIVLNTLGIEDYGIYNVVGGVVAMFSFFNGTLSGATSRFLTFELGTSRVCKLKEVFRAALTIHLALAVGIFFLGGTVGYWFMENKLVIPESRMHAARIVYFFSVLTCMVAILQVPFNAAIIAHERMNVYAYVSIIEACTKLIVVYLLSYMNFDKLVLYAVLMFVVTGTIALSYGIYACRAFEECRLKLSRNGAFLKPMLSYSGWDLYGNLSVMARGQGINVLQNMFFGPVINAASGVATQVQNAVAGFADNFLTAVRPQIVKNYASARFSEMQSLIMNASKYSFLMLFIISLPLILENRFVLTLWLKQVPAYAVVFCQLSLINNLVGILFRSIAFSIHATGKMRRISFINGTIFLLVIPVSYFLLRAGFSPVTPFVVNIVLLLFGSASNLYTLKLYVPAFSVREFLCRVVRVCLITVATASVVPVIVHMELEEGWVRFFIVSLVSLATTALSVYYIALGKRSREKVVQAVFRKIKHG